MNLKNHLNLKMFSLEHDNPSRFVQCPWKQKNIVSLSFLAYRVIIALVVLGVLAWSMITYWNSGKWFIYLTHWTFLALSLEICIGAILVLRAYRKETSLIQHHSLTDHSNMMPISYKLYWMIYNMVLPNVFSVSIVYWILVYNPENKTLDGPKSLNYMMHAGNSVVAFLELVFAGLPFRVQHVVHPLAFEAIYMSFNFIYCSLGGTDPLGKPWVYEQLNWRDVKKTSLMIFLRVLLLLMLHILIVILTGIRSRMARWFRDDQKSQTNSVDNVPMIPIK
ncbi:protein rolling stone-like [Arctopsyche grandis]|uniref:protein rolling stone-like n=1 Tax=Arctopsyche grandis TaxID=121162 RepID=UPI00406D9B6D